VLVARRMPDPDLLYLGTPCNAAPDHSRIRYRSSHSCFECVTKPWPKEVINALIEQLQGTVEAA
jgi:hypothetical protein